MGTILTLDRETGKRYTFDDDRALGTAIQTYGYVPLHADGTLMVMQTFLGGYLLDGAPLNVWIKGVWYEGQKEALAGAWANGTVPRPIPSIEGAPVVPMPADVAEHHAEYLATLNGETGFAGIPTPVLIGGLALIAWKLLR